MRPEELSAASFSNYPTQARAVAAENLAVLQRIPMALLPLILRQLIDYDWLFPPEQRTLTGQLKWTGALAPADFDKLMAPFAAISLPAELIGSDWVNQPKHFSEQLTAVLWLRHQIDAFHGAARAYEQGLQAATAAEPQATPRYTLVVIGDGVKSTDLNLYRKLRRHGTLFTAVDPASGLPTLCNFVSQRAQQFPGAYAHWYIDGGVPETIAGGVTGVQTMAYGALAPAVRRDLSLLYKDVMHPSEKGPSNVEGTVSSQMDLTPKDLGLDDHDVLQRFAVQVLTEGAGTQVYSTTFVQWSARECLHRAEPLTLLARFRPRQEAATMNELLSRDPFQQATDPERSLVDADMGAYLTWINQSRLRGADQSRFLAWFEGHSMAIAIGPAMARGVISDGPTTLNKILGWMA